MSFLSGSTQKGPATQRNLPWFQRFARPVLLDRKSTRLNSSHLVISYAVFCLKKKKLSTSALFRTLADEFLLDHRTSPFFAICECYAITDCAQFTPSIGILEGASTSIMRVYH